MMTTSIFQGILVCLALSSPSNGLMSLTAKPRDATQASREVCSTAPPDLPALPHAL